MRGHLYVHRLKLKMVCIGLKRLLAPLQLTVECFSVVSPAGLIDPAGSGVSWAEVLVMVCCVSAGSGDSSNVGVIYRPLNKQASLRQPVNVGPNDCSESGVWGASAALKTLPGDPSAKWGFYLRFISFGINLLTEKEVEVWAQARVIENSPQGEKTKIYTWRLWPENLAMHREQSMTVVWIK